MKESFIAGGGVGGEIGVEHKESELVLLTF